MVIRYIHQNPVKAGIVQKPDDCLWSSCRAYYYAKENQDNLTQTQFILSIFANHKETAIERMRNFEAENDIADCLDYIEKKRLNQETARKVILEKLNGRQIEVLKQLPLKERNEVLRQIKEIEGLSLRQIARITGLTVNMIYKA
jgi:DNA-directed RNA polymerase specialized sigma24 family protein